MPRYKYCIVPECKNTTLTTPDKLFFSVPTGEKRKEWCLVIGRIPGKHKTLSPRCNRFVCEDHFNLQEDMENYMMWRTVGVGKLILKKGILPHKFECQNLQRCDRKSDTVSDRTKQTDTEMCHAAVIPEIKDKKDKKAKKRKRGRVYIYKGNDNKNPQNIEYEIKKEVTECVSMSENEVNIIIKEEVDVMETYVFNVHYDIDTGAEYLIDITKKLNN